MGAIERFAIRHKRSRVNHFVEMIRLGWNNYSFVFYIGSIAAILSQFFGIAAGAAIVVTILFFYYAGRVKRVMDNEDEEERLRKLKHRIAAP